MPAVSSSQSFVPGYWVALWLREEIAELRVYVGQVQAVDAHGLRLTLIDWLGGRATGWDFFAPWDAIAASLIATPEHDVGSFGEAGSDWQRRAKTKLSQPEAKPAGEAAG
jgi:hypothetical protein